MKLFSKIVFGICLFSSTAVYSKTAKQEDFYENVTRLNKVLLEINRKYVEEIDSKKLTESAISGIRELLDPHTVVFTPEDYSDLKVSTEGEFGGLGITIAIRDNILTVIAPLHGTPAYRMGLLAGDRIVKIGEDSTEGISIQDAVDKLRGKVGTEVSISIAREGIGELLEFVIIRDKIVIQSVPFHGIVAPGIGLIRVASFAKNTGRDVEKAIVDLQQQGMKKLILDLRFNPGGLLTQAIELGDLFLDKNKLVVSTKGRIQETEAFSENDPIFEKEKHLVVLVNGGSASASEIVSGAIQDWDRGIVMGETTFGKGSVQTIYPLDHEGHALKMTTAFYYLPQGRCINKPENGVQSLRVDIKADSAAIDSNEVKFKTANGRDVLSNGGITPDVEVKPRALDWLEILLERRNFFFKYIVKQRPKLESQGVKIDANWEVPDAMLEDFTQFVLKDTSYTKGQIGSEKMMTVLEELFEKEKNIPSDSLEKMNDPLVIKIEELKKILEAKKTTALGLHIEYIKRALKRELLLSFQGDRASTAFNMSHDEQVKEAIRYLNDQKLYDSVLSGQVTTDKMEAEKEPEEKTTEN